MYRPQTPPRLRQFVTRGSKKPSPMRHKNPCLFCNLQETNNLVPSKIKHTHPGRNASPASQARETRGSQKLLPTRLPISSSLRNLEKQRNLARDKKIHTHTKSSRLPSCSPT